MQLSVRRGVRMEVLAYYLVSVSAKMGGLEGDVKKVIKLIMLMRIKRNSTIFIIIYLWFL